MLVWYGLFIFTSVWLSFATLKNKFLLSFVVLIIFISILNIIISPSYFAREKHDQHAELITNYGRIMQVGEVIRALSKPGDTLFLDGSDDLIYWQAKLPSPYKYVWYTSSMPAFKKYTDARLEMFHDNPPTFYREYGSCPKKTDVAENYRLPDFIANQYVRLYNFNKPSCLFVRKDELQYISKLQWQKAAESLYTLPENEKN